MRVLFTGGGTLGSVTPLLAVAEELKKRGDVKMVWIGTRRGPERQLVAEAGIKFSWTFAPKWRRYFDIRNLFTPLALHLATKIAWFKLLRMRPDVIVTAGGYVGVPVVWAAWWLRIWGIRIPCVLHNQDVRWSLANRLASPFVKLITYALPGTVPKKWHKKSLWTGNPVRAFVLKGNRERGLTQCGFDARRSTIMVLGGGTGAKRLNETVVEALPELTGQYQVIHLTGRGKSNAPQPPLKARVGEGGVMKSSYRTFEFVTKEIPDLYGAADLVVTRAGMGVLSELAALQKPMIIVPIPGSHQEENAKYFEARGAAIVLLQNKLSGEKLAATVRGLFEDLGTMQELKERLKELAKSNAAKLVAEEIVALG